MKKYIASLLLVPALFLAACTTTGTGGGGIPPAVETILTNIVNFAINFAENYITTHYSASKAGASRAQGVALLKAEIKVKYNVSDEVAETYAVAAFAKVTRR